MKASHDSLPGADAALGRLHSALAEGRVDEAVVIAQEAAGEAPHDARVIAGLATALKRAGRVAEARSVLTDAPPELTGTSGDRVEMAALCLREGIAEPAKEILRSTLEADHSNVRAAELLARAYLTERDFAAVAAVCEPFRSRGATAPTLLRLLAAAYENVSDLEQAADCAHHYTLAAPLDPRGHYHLGTLEHRLGNLPDAMDRYDLTIELGSHDPQLMSAAADGIRALDAVQIRQISALAATDTGFRLTMDRDLSGALEEAGFLLSDEGLALIAGMDLEALMRSRPGGSHIH